MHRHAVGGGHDVRGQLAPQFLVVEIDVQVREDGAFRLQDCDPFERLLDGEVARMRDVAQRVDYPQVEAAKLILCVRRESADVG